MIIYKVMETTASTAKKAQIVKTICATVSTTALFFSVSHYGSVCLTIHRFFLFSIRNLLYSDQTNFGSDLLSFIAHYKIEPCLYQIVLLGDLTFGSHYEGSAQEIVTGLDVLCGSLYTFRESALTLSSSASREAYPIAPE